MSNSHAETPGGGQPATRGEGARGGSAGRSPSCGADPRSQRGTADETPGECRVGGRRVVVVKLGGSVLTGLEGYRAAAAFLDDAQRAAPDECFVAVVSAEFGQTDALLDLARRLSPEPNPGALDLLWSTGEVRSVALLTLALQARGVSAAGLDVQACGLVLEPAASPDAAGGHPVGEARVCVLALRLFTVLARVRVVVVPGFLAKTPGDGVANLGRGGSDLTAVLLAGGLGAARCELIKDVPGYFTADPHRDPAAAPIEELDFADALRMAAAGCDLVQTRALQAACSAGTRIVVRALETAGRRTIVDAPHRLQKNKRGGPGSAIESPLVGTP